MNILKEAAKFIGWLSGSVAGIAALLTACGYLITTAHLHLLGLDLLYLDYGTEFYIRRGGNFAFFVGNVLMQRLVLPLLVIAIPAAAGGFLVFLAVRGRPWFQRLRGRLTGPGAGELACSTVCKLVVYVILIALFVFQLAGRLDLFVTPLSISHVLYGADAADSEEERVMREWIVKGETSRLRMHFSDVLISVVLAGVLLFAAWLVTSGLRLRALLVAPFAIMFFVYLLLFPRVYGVLVVPSEFAPVVISTKDTLPSGQGARLYLINKGGDDFVLWNATDRRLLWISKGEVRTAEISRSTSILREHEVNGGGAGK